MNLHQLIDALVESDKHYEEKTFYVIYRRSKADDVLVRFQVYAPSIVEAVYIVAAFGVDLLYADTYEYNCRWINLLLGGVVNMEYPRSWYDQLANRRTSIKGPESLYYEVFKGFRAISTSEEWVEQRAAEHPSAD